LLQDATIESNNHRHTEALQNRYPHATEHFTRVVIIHTSVDNGIEKDKTSGISTAGFPTNGAFWVPTGFEPVRCLLYQFAFWQRFLWSRHNQCLGDAYYFAIQSPTRNVSDRYHGYVQDTGWL